MKKLLFLLLLMPAFCIAQQNDKLLYGYAYGMIHDGSFGGGLAGNVELWNLINIGPAVELTSFDGHTMIPVFLDVKIKHRMGNWSPYIAGQFGYNNYNVKKIESLTAPSGVQQMTTFNETGKYFWGAGAGIIRHFKYFGVYASYLYRGYTYKYPPDIKINDEIVNISDKLVSTNVFILGVTF